jgi:hypothetical protein
MMLVGMASGLAAGVVLILLAVIGKRRDWGSRRRAAYVVAGGAVLLTVVGVAADGILSPQTTRDLTPGEQVMADFYNSPWGGLTLPHRFGPGKSNNNPPDILEAGGNLVDLKLTPDGDQVDSLTLETLQGKKFTFLIRPAIVAFNIDIERLRIYRDGTCFMALHFVKRDIGNIAIVMFPVIIQPDD